MHESNLSQKNRTSEHVGGLFRGGVWGLIGV